MILPERILHCQSKPGEHGRFGVVISRFSVYPFVLVLVLVIVLGIPSVFEEGGRDGGRERSELTMFKNFPWSARSKFGPSPSRSFHGGVAPSPLLSWPTRKHNADL